MLQHHLRAIPTLTLTLTLTLILSLTGLLSLILGFLMGPRCCNLQCGPTILQHSLNYQHIHCC